MGQANPPNPSKLIIGLIYKDPQVKTKAVALLSKSFGKIDYQSPILDFNYTAYYSPEMGRPLKRLFVSFKKLVSEEKLADIKVDTNSLEEKFSAKGKRRINIDPGFLSGGKLVLATTKNYNHRVYLKKGIFAEVTLFYKKDGFHPWPWSYPDYQSQEYLAIFNTIRTLSLPGLIPRSSRGRQSRQL